MIAAGGGVEERVEPGARRSGSAERDVRRIRPRGGGENEVGAAARPGERSAVRVASVRITIRFSKRSIERSSKRRFERAGRGVAAPAEVRERRERPENPRLRGRVGAVPAPPRPSVGREDGVRRALRGAYIASFEDDSVLVLAHLDSVPLEGAANRPIAALGVRAVVAVPGDERRLARPGERGEGAVRCALEDDEPGAGRVERAREVEEARMQKAEAWMRLAMPPNERVVKNEHRGQLMPPAACRGERGVVLDPKIAPEPVN